MTKKRSSEILTDKEEPFSGKCVMKIVSKTFHTKNFLKQGECFICSRGMDAPG